MPRWSLITKKKTIKKSLYIYVHSLGRTTYQMLLYKIVLETVPMVPVGFNKSHYKEYTTGSQMLLKLNNQSESRSVVSDSLWPHGLYSPWNSPGQNTGVGSLSLLQGIFPTQGSNSGFPHHRQIIYQLSHQGSPIRIETQYTFIFEEQMWIFESKAMRKGGIKGAEVGVRVMQRWISCNRRTTTGTTHRKGAEGQCPPKEGLEKSEGPSWKRSYMNTALKDK